MTTPMKESKYQSLMQKAGLFGILWMCCFFQLNGQNLGPNWNIQSIQELSISFEVKEQDDRLFLQVDQPILQGNGLELSLPYLDDADLVLPYTSSLPKKDFAARVLVSIIHQGFGTLARQQELILTVKQTGSIVFPDLTEHQLFFNESYRVQVQLEIAFTGNCYSSPPTFDLRKQIAPGGVALLGLVGIGVGELLLRPRQQNAYDQYVSLWGQERSRAEADPWLAEAESINRQREIFTKSGCLVAMGGICWFGLNYYRNVIQQQIPDGRLGIKNRRIALAGENYRWWIVLDHG